MDDWNTDKALLGGFFIAHWMNEDAEIRAAQANHQARISAYIAQGYNYQQAIAQVQADYVYDAAQRGPTGATAGWMTLTVLWLALCAITTPITNWIPWVVGLVPLAWQVRRFMVRRAWAASR